MPLLASVQRRLIYFPSPGPVPPASALLPDGRDVVLDTEDGLRLGAWFVPAAQRGAAVLVCNGNAGDRALRAPLAAALVRAGLSVLLFDYRGYGGNPADPAKTAWPPMRGPRERFWPRARKSIRRELPTSASRWAQPSRSGSPSSHHRAP
ncbi:hypothetical protein I552_7891 [Mycobacterium xenopi 3993]|nr:hypothetical protein I552_7891 [Mycobacterium xenopi 3993]